MRAAPEDFGAAGASPKLIIINAGERLELLQYFSLIDRLKCPVALEAAGKRFDPFSEIKSPDQFERLLAWIIRPRAVADADDRVHEESAVAGKKGSRLPLHQFEQLRVVRAIIVG